MNRLWSIADLIDLLYFFHLDEEIRERQGDEALVKRDRLIYLTKIRPQLGKAEEVPPRQLVRRWLAVRRLQFQREIRENGAILPGSVWGEMTTVCRVLLFLFGAASGIGLAGSFLLYSGARPLNVAVYFGLFVGLQLLSLILQSGFLLVRRLRRVPMESSVFYLLLGRFFLKGFDALRRRLQPQLSGQRRLDLAALVGTVRQERELAVLVIWPAFLLVQFAAIGFNLGVLGTTLARVVFSDIAFAWQSSLQVTADLVARLVAWLALPWSWLIEHGYPSLEQIRGSQVVLKEGISGLATADLVAWWPFLVAAVVVYGLLPRLALLGLGFRQQQRALARLHFATQGIRPLLTRMTAPQLNTSGAAVTGPQGSGSGPGAFEPEPQAAPWPEPPPPGDGPVMLLVPDELVADCPQAELANLLAPHLNPSRLVLLPYVLAEAGRTDWPVLLAGAAGIFLLQEAWQPPLREFDHLLRRLRAAVGCVPITLLLVGRPRATPFTPPEQGQFRVWQSRLAALADPQLTVQPLVRA